MNPQMLLTDAEFVAFGLETSGLHPVAAQILETPSSRNLSEQCRFSLFRRRFNTLDASDDGGGASGGACDEYAFKLPDKTSADVWQVYNLVEIFNVPYEDSVEDWVHRLPSNRLQDIFNLFGQIAGGHEDA